MRRVAIAVFLTLAFVAAFFASSAPANAAWATSNSYTWVNWRKCYFNSITWEAVRYRIDYHDGGRGLTYFDFNGSTVVSNEYIDEYNSAGVVKAFAHRGVNTSTNDWYIAPYMVGFNNSSWGGVHIKLTLSDGQTCNLPNATF